MAETLLNLRTQCKTEADMTNASFVSDNEWNTWINRGAQEIYGLTAQVFGADYYVQSPSTGYTFTTDGLTQFFALPTDFFKLLGLDVLYGATNQWIGLKPFAIGDHNKFNATNTPIPAAGQQLRMFYIPRFPGLTVDASTIPDALSMNGWSEYIVAWACRQAMMKEESDASQFNQRILELKSRIEAEAENRDAGNADKIVDSRGRGGPGIQYRINGSNIWLIGFQPGAPYFGMDWDVAGPGWGGATW